MLGPRAHDWPLVGRDELLERGRRELSDGAGLVVFGPAGVGKTRFLGEALDRAAVDGYDVASVFATRAAASVPFGAYAHLLADVWEGSATRAQLLGAAVREFRERAAGRPLAVAIDDAHLLDPGSAALTLALATSGTARTLVAVRTGQPCADAITALWKERIAQRIDLAELGQDEVAETLELALGGPVERRRSEWFWRRSRGNPLFLRELVEGSLEAQRLARDEGLWRLVAPAALSPRLVDLVEARLTGLRPGERRVLDLLALAEPLELATLEALTSAAALRNADERRLIAPRTAQHTSCIPCSPK